MADGSLAGRAILVVEDEYFAAADLCGELAHAAAIVVGPASSLEEAMHLIRSTPRIDGAILDINLRGELVYPAADLLRDRRVTFLFATGYDQSMIPARFKGVLRCEKPISPAKLCRHLAERI